MSLHVLAMLDIAIIMASVRGVLSSLRTWPVSLARDACLVVTICGPGWVCVLHWSRAQLTLQLT